MLSSFISRLLLLRQFSLFENEIKVLGRGFYLQPLHQLAILQKKIEEKFGKKGLDLIYDTSKQSFFEMAKDMEKFSSSKSNLFEVLLNLVKHFGFGNVEIIEIKEKELKAIVQVKNNPFAKEYAKLFGFQKEAVDYSLAGIIAGYFSKFFDKGVDCKEESCIAKRNTICRFIIKH